MVGLVGTRPGLAAVSACLPRLHADRLSTRANPSLTNGVTSRIYHTLSHSPVSHKEVSSTIVGINFPLFSGSAGVVIVPDGEGPVWERRVVASSHTGRRWEGRPLVPNPNTFKMAPFPCLPTQSKQSEDKAK